MHLISALGTLATSESTADLRITGTGRPISSRRLVAAAINMAACSN
jgi:hypothetical protein